MRDGSGRIAWPWAALLSLCACLPGVGCRGDGKGSGPVEKRPIEAVLLQHTSELMALQGVVGVYQGALDDGTPCIRVMVVERTHELEEKIPARLEGYRVEIEATGEIRPMSGT